MKEKSELISVRDRIERQITELEEEIVTADSFNEDEALCKGLRYAILKNQQGILRFCLSWRDQAAADQDSLRRLYETEDNRILEMMAAAGGRYVSLSDILTSEAEELDRDPSKAALASKLREITSVIPDIGPSIDPAMVEV